MFGKTTFGSSRHTKAPGLGFGNRFGQIRQANNALAYEVDGNDDEDEDDENEEEEDAREEETQERGTEEEEEETIDEGLGSDYSNLRKLYTDKEEQYHLTVVPPRETPSYNYQLVPETGVSRPRQEIFEARIIKTKTSYIKKCYEAIAIEKAKIAAISRTPTLPVVPTPWFIFGGMFNETEVPTELPTIEWCQMFLRNNKEPYSIVLIPPPGKLVMPYFGRPNEHGCIPLSITIMDENTEQIIFHKTSFIKQIDGKFRAIKDNEYVSTSSEGVHIDIDVHVQSLAQHPFNSYIIIKLISIEFTMSNTYRTTCPPRWPVDMFNSNSKIHKSFAKALDCSISPEYTLPSVSSISAASLPMIIKTGVQAVETSGDAGGGGLSKNCIIS